MNSPARTTPDLDSLIALFYRDPGKLGRFEEVLISKMPDTYRQLLAHTHHMTVTVEQFHGSTVDVQVLDRLPGERHYSRKILLRRHTDGAVVQFGIMRIDMQVLAPEVRREIEAEETPLGRVLIEHDVLRRIHLMSLWKVQPGEELCELFGLEVPTTTYGRAAIIDCNGEPGVELLEIVTPV